MIHREEIRDRPDFTHSTAILEQMARGFQIHLASINCQLEPFFSLSSPLWAEYLYRLTKQNSIPC